ncbi:DUF6893 family small protein [Streptomyces sp. NPDC006692]
MRKSVIGGAMAAAALAVLVKQNLPDIKRYLRMRRM